MSIPPKTIYKFNRVPIKIPMAFFTDLKKTILKFGWDHNRLWIVKIILNKKKKPGGITLHDFKLWKAMVIKTIWYWTKLQTQRSMEQNSLKINSSTSLIIRKMQIKAIIRYQFIARKMTTGIPQRYCRFSLNLQQRKQEYTWERDSIFKKKWCQEKWTATYNKINLGHVLTPYSKIEMDYILKCKVWNHRTPRRKHSSMLFDISLSNIFLDPSKGNKSKNTQMRVS